MVDKSVMNTHFDGIDGLRTYAAIGIVAMHVLSNGFSGLEGFIFNSLIPSFAAFVFLFMLVSSFGMCCGYYEKIKTGNINLSQFYSKRFKKIWPYFAFLIFIDLVVSPSINSLYEAFADLTLVFGLLPGAGNISVIGVGWFLGLVFVFYMLFPFFCFLLENKKRAWLSFIILLAYNLVCAEYFDIGRSNILYSGCYFMAGGLIYLYKESLVKLSSKAKYLLWALMIAFVIMYYAITESALTMIPLFSLMLIYTIVGGTECKHLILSNPVTRFISGISMEIYLSHMVIYRIIEKMNLMYISGNGVLGYFTSLVIVLTGTVVFSFIAQKGINLALQKTIEIRRKTV